MPTPKTSPTLLFAVLEAKGTANAWTYNTVAIAGLDGYSRAKTTFIPIPSPDLGCMGSVLPSSAHVAAGRVYFADGKGVVRSLSTTGSVTTVATFPLTSRQQMLSFAVSPDGSRLLGAVLTASAGYFSCTGTTSGPARSLTLDVYSAPAGGTRTLLYHQSLADSSKVMALTGWDAVGPLGTYPTVWASQGGGPGSTLGMAVRVDAGTGKPLGQLGTTSCTVWHSVQSGAFVCMLQPVPTSSNPYGPVSQPVSIRAASGQEEWQFTVTSVNGAFSPYLAPDEQHVVICCNFDTSSNWLVDRQGNQTLFKTGFYASGWLDAATVFGFSAQQGASPGMLSYVALNSPTTFVSMGFSGSVVGTVRN